MPSIAAPTLEQFISAILVLLGGVGGVLLVWWLDGRRVAHRDRRELIGATDLVCIELSANVASLELWLANAGRVPPLELRWEAWTANQRDIAVGMPRDVTARLAAGYYLVDYPYLDRVARLDPSPDRWRRLAAGRPPAVYFFYRQSPEPMVTWRERGTITTDAVKLATRVQNAQQANLRELQAQLRARGVPFPIEPQGPASAGEPE